MNNPEIIGLVSKLDKILDCDTDHKKGCKGYKKCERCNKYANYCTCTEPKKQVIYVNNISHQRFQNLPRRIGANGATRPIRQIREKGVISAIRSVPIKIRTVSYQTVGNGQIFKVPADVTSIIVELWGGGGGGGAIGSMTDKSSNFGGGGGGSGAYIKSELSVTPSSTISITVGTGGLGGSVGSSGINGTSSSITTGLKTLTADFGIGGGVSHINSPGIGGAGGIATPTIDIMALNGQRGQAGYKNKGGNGGNCPMGGAGGFGAEDLPISFAQDGICPGGGGGGGFGISGSPNTPNFTSIGHNGAAGMVHITYINNL